MTKILILGGGFGGIRVSLDLWRRLKNRKDVQITLIDRNNYQTFYPSLYEVASAFGITHSDPFYTKLRSTISIPLSEIFMRTNVQTIQGIAEEIDLNSKLVTTQGGQKFEFDYLILALGSEVSTYNIPGVNEYAYKFKSVEDALLLFRDIEEVYKKAGSTFPIKHLVVGAGFTGIELAAELAHCTTHLAHKHKLRVTKCTEITILEATPQILPMIDDWERIMIRKRLCELGIEIMENAAITDVRDDHTVILGGSKVLKTDFVIWTAGVKAPEILKSIRGLELNQAGRIVVNNFLQIKNNPHVFAIGDNIIFNISNTTTERERGSTEASGPNVKPIPQVAQLAIKHGNVVAKNIAKLVLNDDTKHLLRYRPSYNTWIAPIGGKHALVHTKYLVFDGYIGWWFRELVDARYFFSILPIAKALKLIFSRIRIFVKND